MTLAIQQQIAHMSVGIHLNQIHALDIDSEVYLFNLLQYLQQAYPDYRFDLYFFADNNDLYRVDIHNAHLNFVPVNRDFSLIKYRELQQKVMNLVSSFTQQARENPLSLSCLALIEQQKQTLRDAIERAQEVRSYQQKVKDMSEILRCRKEFNGYLAHLNFADRPEIFITDAECQVILIAKATTDMLVVEQILALLSQLALLGHQQGEFFIAGRPEAISYQFEPGLDYAHTQNLYKQDKQIDYILHEFLQLAQDIDTGQDITNIKQVLAKTHFNHFIQGAEHYIYLNREKMDS